MEELVTELLENGFRASVPIADDRIVVKLDAEEDHTQMFEVVAAYEDDPDIRMLNSGSFVVLFNGAEL